MKLAPSLLMNYFDQVSAGKTNVPAPGTQDCQLEVYQPLSLGYNEDYPHTNTAYSINLGRLTEDLFPQLEVQVSSRIEGVREWGSEYSESGPSATILIDPKTHKVTGLKGDAKVVDGMILVD